MPEIKKKTTDETEVVLLVDTIYYNGEFVHKKETPKLKVARWLANSMVTQGVAEIVGVK